jgi:hypothetical protein
VGAAATVVAADADGAAVSVRYLITVFVGAGVAALAAEWAAGACVTVTGDMATPLVCQYGKEVCASGEEIYR